MPIIKGFKGLRYNNRKIGDPAKVFAPPYDVISPKEQDRLHALHPFNVIRLELAKEKSGDTAVENKYTRAGAVLREWTAQNVLQNDAEESIYVYEQQYMEEGRLQTRIGFLAAMFLDEKAVLKHENTLAGPKQDRLALLKEVRTNLSPIFGLFEDKKADVNSVLKKILKTKPAVDVKIEGVRHKVFVESDPATVSKISSFMTTKPMFIADGHHRFEVACQYKNLMLQQNGSAVGTGWKYVMTYFADVLHNPFKIFPTHRLITLPKGMKDPLEALAKKGTLKKVKNLDAVLKLLSKTREEAGNKASYQFGVYSKKQGFYFFDLEKSLAKKAQKSVVERLDVAVLHSALIAPCFKITKIEKSAFIDFTRDAKAAEAKVKSGEFDVAFFLRPTSLKEMIDVSKKGLKMPQKSTYFYPKLLSGLVFHSFDEN